MNVNEYRKEILEAIVDLNESEEQVNTRYVKLNKMMESIYNFILAYSNYYSIRRDYGSGEKFTMIEMHILTEICDNDGITVTELAKKWDKTSSAISQTVRRLMKWNLINRINNEDNGKIYHLSISQKGKEIVLFHKRYDNLDIIKTQKILARKFKIEELVAFEKICLEYTNILKERKKK
ncbi:MAG: MarR family transcriptional regulator [Fusobacterium sp.]|uniref:MarR family transcriptional regulator n=1 Tax=Fusobacterium sp. TaxID=68766 RepID=UPI0026DD0661|nr:MarR family transcriptional regulator [Fusobacterium sp.]MDO4690403.1 MarR family transcriptional regulator [Fusobacterium sp.]